MPPLSAKTKPLPPAKQLDQFIRRFDPPIQRLIRGALAAMRKTYPTATRLAYDNYNALAIGFCATPRVSTCLVSVAAYPRGVNLYFFYGASLPDPTRRLQGAGRQGRFVRFEGPATVRESAVRALLRAAGDAARVPLPKTGRGPLIIQSIARKRRSRTARSGAV